MQLVVVVDVIAFFLKEAESLSILLGNKENGKKEKEKQNAERERIRKGRGKKMKELVKGEE